MQELAVGPLLRDRVASLSDTVGPLMEGPWAMTAWGDSLAIADMMGSRIHVMSRSFSGGREFGRSGSGPGEIKSPQGIATYGEHLLVFDRGNAKTVWFDWEGGAVRERQGMIVSLFPKFAALDSTTLLLPIASPDYYAAAASTETSREVFPRESATPRALGPGITSNMVVAFDGGHAVVDVENGIVIMGLGPNSIRASLPDALWDQANPEMERIRAADPRGERLNVPVVAAGPAGEGVVVLTRGEGPFLGGVLHASGTWTLLRANSPSLPAPTEWRDVMIWGAELFLLAGDGIRVYALGPG